MYPLGFPYGSKLPPLGILKFLVDTLLNQGKKVSFNLVDEDGALARSSEFMRTCNNMNIIVQIIGGDAYYLNGKIENPNNTIANITRDPLLISIHNK